MKPRLRFALACTLLCITHAPAPAQDAIVKGKPLTAPFDLLQTQHMVVEVKINGKGPYRLIFDTGAPINLINNKVAKEADVFPKDFKKPPFALFGSMGQFKIKSLEIGDVKAENLSTMVMDHPTVEAISKALGPIEGIVGLSFFGKYAMTIDYQAKTMTFTPNDYQPVDMIENLMKMLLSSKNKTKVLAPGGILGITVEKSKDDEETGVVVKTVLADSAAAQAGVKAGDRLISVDGRWTDTVTDCFTAFSLIAPATPVQAVIRRDGKEQKLQLELRPGI